MKSNLSGLDLKRQVFPILIILKNALRNIRECYPRGSGLMG